MRRLFAAVVTLSLAAALHAESAHELFAAGKQALLQKDAAKAADLLEQAVALNPNSSEYHFWLGRAYGREAEEASIFRQASLASRTRKEFERAVELDPNNLDARSALIDFYLEAPALMGGGHDKAVRQANEIRTRNALEGHFAFAHIYEYDKNQPLARKEWTEAVHEQPGSAEAHYLFATGVLMPDKNWKQAIEELETALKLDPAYMPAYFRIGEISALTSSDYTRGENALKKYLAWTPDEDEDDPPLFRAWYWLGQIEEKTGRPAAAKESYATSLRLKSNQKDVIEALKRLR